MSKRKNAFTLSLRVCMTALLMFLCSAIYAQNVTVKGSVTDKTGEPVIGATVKTAGSKTGVITNVDGEYVISCPSNAILEFNYIGYQTQKINVAGKTKIDVVLQEESTNLNEVVVTALGTNSFYFQRIRG